MLENMRLSTPLVFYYAVLFQEHVLWSFEIREVSCNDTNDCSVSLDTWHVSRLCCRLSIYPLLWCVDIRHCCCCLPAPEGAFSVITKLRMNLFQALLGTDRRSYSPDQYSVSRPSCALSAPELRALTIGHQLRGFQSNKLFQPTTHNSLGTKGVDKISRKTILKEGAYLILV